MHAKHSSRPSACLALPTTNVLRAGLSPVLRPRAQSCPAAMADTAPIPSASLLGDPGHTTAPPQAPASSGLETPSQLLRGRAKLKQSDTHSTFHWLNYVFKEQRRPGEMGSHGSALGCRIPQAPRPPSASEKRKQQRLRHSGGSAGRELRARSCGNTCKRLRLGIWGTLNLNFHGQ